MGIRFFFRTTDFLGRLIDALEPITRLPERVTGITCVYPTEIQKRTSRFKLYRLHVVYEVEKVCRTGRKQGGREPKKDGA